MVLDFCCSKDWHPTEAEVTLAGANLHFTWAHGAAPCCHTFPGSTSPTPARYTALQDPVISAARSHLESLLCLMSRGFSSRNMGGKQTKPLVSTHTHKHKNRSFYIGNTPWLTCLILYSIPKSSHQKPSVAQFPSFPRKTTAAKDAQGNVPCLFSPPLTCLQQRIPTPAGAGGVQYPWVSRHYSSSHSLPSAHRQEVAEPLHHGWGSPVCNAKGNTTLGSVPWPEGKRGGCVFHIKDSGFKQRRDDYHVSSSGGNGEGTEATAAWHS